MRCSKRSPPRWWWSPTAAPGSAPLPLHWPDTVIQRCIFHLQLNVTRELTRNPRLRAGRDLRHIALALSDLHTVDDAITWRLTLEAWWKTGRHLLRERTLYDNGHFGYTYKPLRKAWAILHRVAENEHAFTFVRNNAPRTTSRLEGLNSQIRHLLRHHRGMPIEHQRRAVEWFLMLHEVPIDHAHRHTHAPRHQPRTRTHTSTSTPPAPPSTTTASTPPKASGSEQDGQDDTDTPEPIHYFWPISRYPSARTRKRQEARTPAILRKFGPQLSG